MRGPTIADVTPGWLMTNAIAISMRLIPASSASSARSSTMSSLRWLAGLLMSNRALGRAADVGLAAASLRHRPESQPPESGL